MTKARELADLAGSSGGGIDVEAERLNQVIQSIQGAEGFDWSAGMAFDVVDEVPADSDGAVGDVVFVTQPGALSEGEAGGIQEETGTWTPVWANPTTGESTNSATGTYVKQGSLVWLEATMNLTLTRDGHQIKISGCPFPPANSNVLVMHGNTNFKSEGGGFEFGTSVLCVNHGIVAGTRTIYPSVIYRTDA